MMNKYSKILIISNNCFSKTDSNGRTLAGFFKGYPKEKLAQFYLQNAVPDFEVCDNYFRVTDSQALRAFLKNRKTGGKVKEEDFQQSADAVAIKKKSRKRTPFTMLLRETVWNSRKWWGKDFEEWINAFAPEIVLLQMGDNAFMLKIATDIAQKNAIPLMIYNSENYYFKDKNYMRNSGIATVLYPTFIKKYRKQFDKTIEYTAHSVYICEELKKTYDEKFHKNSTAIYTASSLAPTCAEREKNPVPVISYLGNLGVGRHEPLIEIAEALYALDSAYRLDVYGRFPNEEVKKRILDCKGIRYNGFVSYEEVVAVMKRSDLLVHAENFSPFYKEDLKFAFSTKIADSLSCGSVLLYYAPRELASTKYLSEHGAAYVVSEKEALAKILSMALNDKKTRETVRQNALELAKENHDAEKNREKFWGIIEKVCYEDSAN